jgi:hypothetical protein
VIVSSSRAFCRFLEERNGGEPCVRCHLTPHLHHHPTVVVEWFQAVAAFHRITPYRCKTLLSGSHSLLLSLSSPLLLPPPSPPHIWSHAASLEEWHGRDKAGGSSTTVVSASITTKSHPSPSRDSVCLFSLAPAHHVGNTVHPAATWSSHCTMAVCMVVVTLPTLPHTRIMCTLLALLALLGGCSLPHTSVSLT